MMELADQNIHISGTEKMLEKVTQEAE